MDIQSKILQEAEQEANEYVARCLTAAGWIGLIILVLNMIDVFTVRDVVMNTTMPIGIVVLLIPVILIRKFKCCGPWVKYCAVLCFMVGIAIMHSGMTYQVLLAWACPILLSCHYYTPRVTKTVFIASVVFSLLAYVAGLYYGSWDANIANSTLEVNGIMMRQAYMQAQLLEGRNIWSIMFNFYYIPFIMVLSVVYFISNTLSTRTHALLDKQQRDFLEQETIGAELSIAAEIQNSMLPNAAPFHPKANTYELHATMTPSKEVGGDFYDFFLVDDDHLALVIADVSGKGIPGAMFMMATKIMIKNCTTPDKTPAQVLTEVNNRICKTNENDMFVTVWFAIYEISTGSLIAANAGHEYPIIQRNTQNFELIKGKHGFVIGGMEDIHYHNYEMKLEQGDTLFVYTDGVLEAIDKDNAVYGSQRLLKQLDATTQQSLEIVLDGVKKDVDLFAGDVPQFDDITMLSIRRK